MPNPITTLRKLDADKARNARTTLGLTQRQMAERFNVTTRTVQRWEDGSSAVTGAAVPLYEILLAGG